MNGIELPIADKFKMILLNHNLYACFSIAIKDPLEMDQYAENLKRALLYYFSLPLTNYENRIGFIQGFFEGYMVLDHDSILTTVSDTSALFYDSSLESFIARALAIAENHSEGTCREIFANLENTLQSSKNVI